MAVEQPELIRAFQDAVRPEYPVLRPEQTKGLVVTSGGVAPAQQRTTWRFSDIDGRWRLSLAPDFLALETTSYESRSRFLERLGRALEVLAEHVDPALVDRLGVRYIDRITGTAVGDIDKLVRPEVRGIVGTPAARHVQHTLSESIFALENESVLARWGCLPAGATLDPSAIEPISEVSWILDLDMFSTKQVPYSSAILLKDVQRFSERLYTFFRWTVTKEFLRRYGGEL
jgi:uncharacterized protein (TIGR04255 family)